MAEAGPHLRWRDRETEQPADKALAASGLMQGPLHFEDCSFFHLVIDAESPIGTSVATFTTSLLRARQDSSVTASIDFLLAPTVATVGLNVPLSLLSLIFPKIPRWRP